MGFPDEILFALKLSEADALVRAVDHAHMHGGFTSKAQSDCARQARRRLKDEVAEAWLAAAVAHG